MDHNFYGDFGNKHVFVMFWEIIAKTSKFLILTPYGFSPVSIFLQGKYNEDKEGLVSDSTGHKHHDKM